MSEQRDRWTPERRAAHGVMVREYAATHAEELWPPERRQAHSVLMASRLPIEKLCLRCSQMFMARGYNSRYCDECRPIAKIEYRMRLVLRSHGVIDPDDVRQWIEALFGNCTLCGAVPERWGRLVIDHDHKTGKVRGALCERCNLVLGKVSDDVELLTQMISYLRRSNK
jgi:hypothetical protein